MNTYREASRAKLRFQSPRGSLSVEDLWDIPLTGPFSLNEIAVDLHNKLARQEVTFVKTASAADTEPPKIRKVWRRC